MSDLFTRHDVSENLLMPEDIIEQYGLTRPQITYAVETGRIKPIYASARKRIFWKPDIENFIHNKNR